MKQRKHTKLPIIMGDANANFRQVLVSIGISAISGTEEKLWTLRNKKQKSQIWKKKQNDKCNNLSYWIETTVNGP